MNRKLFLTMITICTFTTLSLAVEIKDKTKEKIIATKPKTTVETKTETKPTGAKVTTTTKKTTHVTDKGIQVTETNVTAKEQGPEGNETTTQHTHVSAKLTSGASSKLQGNLKKLGAIFGGKKI